MEPRKVKGRRNVKKTKSNSIDDVDVISSLPSDIIDNILIRLPIQEAVRTSVLSKKWRFEWLYISQLVFGGSNELFRSISSTSPEKIWSLIYYQILLLHRGPLCKIVLDVHDLLEDAFSSLNRIMLHLTGKDIQELTLFPPPMATATKYTLPSTLFLFTHLTHLVLMYCIFIFKPPHENLGFSKLVSVQLFSVDFTATDFKAFLSKCPLLQKLLLVDCKKGTHVEIDAPNLKLLWFDCPAMSILFKNVPLLREAIIKRSARLAGQSSDIVQVFGSLPAITYFSVGEHFLMDLSASVVLERLPMLLNNLEFVELCGLHCNSSKEVQFALLMIRSSPNLYELTIQLDEYDNDLDDVPIKSLYLAEDSIDQLCEVVMENFNGTVREVEFIELLLAKSLILEKIIIQPPKEISDKKAIEISKAVARFERAPTKAQIIFLDSAKDMQVNGGTPSYLTVCELLKIKKFD